MNCPYCQHLNSEDEPRCLRCGRRLVEETRPVTGGYRTAQAVALAVATRVAVEEPPEPAVELPTEAPRISAPRQARFPFEGDTLKVVPIRKAEPAPRSSV